MTHPLVDLQPVLKPLAKVQLNIFKEGELDEKVACRKFRQTTQHGAMAGKVNSSDGPSMPFGWSACARYTGIRSPPSGHRQPLCWATTAHNAGERVPKYRTHFWAIFF